MCRAPSPRIFWSETRTSRSGTDSTPSPTPTTTSPATCSPPTWSASSDPSLSALIPLAYQLVSVASIAAFARTKRYRFCRASQLTMMLLLPFLLQWSLSGFGQSSAVALWALMAALGALVFLDCAGLSPG